MTQLKAIVFDFDGLILDTESQMYNATQTIYNRYKVHLPLSIWSQSIGSHGGYFDAVDYLQEKSGKKIDRHSFYSERKELMAELIEKLQPLPGAERLIRNGKENGLKLGLSTSSEAGWATGHLERLGLLDYFDFVQTADDVEEAKPHPALYLQTVRGLGVEPHEAVAFEDSANGAKSAVAAGIHCFVVPNDMTRQLTFPEEAEKLSSLENISIADLFNRFSQDPLTL